MAELNLTLERLNTALEHAIDTQKQQGERLEMLEARDGEMWRRAAGYMVTAVIGIVIGFTFKQIGM